MRPIRELRGRMVPLDRSDVDTDQIMAKQHLKRIDREGFGDVVFEDWRRDPDFVLNDSRFAGASILLAGPNFGAGSSREHAVWGLHQYGFDAVLSSRFADIFRNNADKAGLLAVELSQQVVDELMALARRAPQTELAIDVVGEEVRAGEIAAPFDLNAYTKKAITNGWDFIDMTLQQRKAIDAFEVRRSVDPPIIR